ncbi:MAG: hypothetical protein LBQ54_12330 [Planctomycetaceae bacterium]|jgi:type II secretion system protein D|nr:hypothetical protein [Planctomycetaceae bacterium]
MTNQPSLGRTFVFFRGIAVLWGIFGIAAGVIPCFSQENWPRNTQGIPHGNTQGPNSAFMEQRWAVQFVPLRDAETQLRNSLSRTGVTNIAVTQDPVRNHLILSGDSAAIQLAGQMLQEIDKPVAPAQNFPIRQVAQQVPQPMSQPFVPQYSTQNALPSQNTYSPPFPQQAPPTLPLPHQVQPTLSALPTAAPEPEVRAAIEPNEAKSYYCKKMHFTRIAQAVIGRYGNQPRVDIDVRPESGRILVWAPGSVQQEIHRLIQQMDGLENVPVDRSPLELDGTILRIVPESKPSQTRNVPPIQSSHSPQNVTLETIETKLQALFGERMMPQPKTSEETKTFRIVIPRPEGTRAFEVEFHSKDYCVNVTGNPNIVEEFMQLVGNIDQASPKEGYERRYISIRNSDPEKIRKLLEMYRMKNAPDSRRKHPANPNIQQVAYLAQEESGGTPAGNPTGAVPGSMQGSSRTGNAIGTGETNGMGYGYNLPGTEEVEMIPGIGAKISVLRELDIIVIDAPGAEVSRIIKMIEQIEEISSRAEPTYDIVFLKNINCQSLDNVIRTLSRDLFITKPGNVWILPLVNPNAMLVLGWDEAKSAMLDLITYLDKPVESENSMLRVLKLEYVSAEYVVSAVEAFFQQPGQLQSFDFAPRVRIMSDARSNSVIVQAAPNDYREVERLVSELDIARGGTKLVMKIYKLEYILARDMVTSLEAALRPGMEGTSDNKLPILSLLTQNQGKIQEIESGFLTDATFSAHPPNNTLVVNVPAESLALIDELVKLMDVPPGSAQIKVFPIKYSDAVTLRTTLETLLPTQIAGQGGPQLPVTEGEESFTPIRISIDTRSNSLVVVASQGAINLIEALLANLDQKDAMDRQFKVIPLRNSSAVDVANAINRYMTANRSIQDAGVVSAYQQLESEVIAVPEPVSNMLIIDASAAYLTQIEKLVDDLDKEPLQVVIQVMIGEVTLSDTDEFGIELGLQDPVLFNRSILSDIQRGTATITNGNTTVEEIISATNTPGFNFNSTTNAMPNSGSSLAMSSASTVGAQALSNFATGRINNDTGFGGLILSASSDAVSILIRAMQENNRFEVLSRPQVTAQDNQLALVFVGQEVQRIGDITMTSYGAQNSMQNKNVGLLLGVVPRIDPRGEKVVMLISAEKSSLSTDGVMISEGVRSSNINQIRTETIVSAKDGETVLLGGLISKETNQLERRVPYLSDIPILGNFFQYRFNKTKRTELVIIMRPRIIKDRKDMDEIRRVELARLNWCLADVVKIHGNVDVYTATQPTPVTGNALVEEPSYVDPDQLRPNDLPPMPQKINTPGSPNPPTLNYLPNPSLRPSDKEKALPLQPVVKENEADFPAFDLK